MSVYSVSKRGARYVVRWKMDKSAERHCEHVLDSLDYDSARKEAAAFMREPEPLTREEYDRFYYQRNKHRIKMRNAMKG